MFIKLNLWVWVFVFPPLPPMGCWVVVFFLGCLVDFFFFKIKNKSKQKCQYFLHIPPWVVLRTS